MIRKKPGNPRVLVIEDEDAIVRVLRLSLRSNGFDTAQAESGREALEAMDGTAFDAVVLDLCLPDGRGGDVLQRLQVGGRRPAWIVMSALDEDEATRRFGPLRGPFLPKPFDPMELVKLLDSLVRRRRRPGNRQMGAAAV